MHSCFSFRCIRHHELGHILYNLILSYKNRLPATDLTCPDVVCTITGREHPTSYCTLIHAAMKILIFVKNHERKKVIPNHIQVSKNQRVCCCENASIQHNSKFLIMFTVQPPPQKKERKLHVSLSLGLVSRCADVQATVHLDIWLCWRFNASFAPGAAKLM